MVPSPGGRRPPKVARVHVARLIVAAGLTLWLPVTAVANGFVRRPDVSRTLHHEDPVIERALTELGQPLNRIAVISPAEIRRIYVRAGAGWPSPGLEAFRSPLDPGDPTIYVNREAPAYKMAARARSAFDLLKLASILVHEQVHNTDIEFAAYRLQADFIRSRLRKLPGQERDRARRYTGLARGQGLLTRLGQTQEQRRPRSSANESPRAMNW